jgi:hypothetical protein
MIVFGGSCVGNRNRKVGPLLIFERNYGMITNEKWF